MVQKIATAAYRHAIGDQHKSMLNKASEESEGRIIHLPIKSAVNHLCVRMHTKQSRKVMIK